MSRFSLSGFRDPVRRPRHLIWTAVAVMCLGLFVALGGIIGTSTYWFCHTPCHKVQADTLAAYDASTHANIPCVACHEPANGTPLQVILAKARSMGEIPPTATNTYRLPINRGSALALNEHEMGSKQCVQCHTKNRNITPDGSVKINHEVHEKENVTCTMCHNRIAHNDAGIELALDGNKPHESFMEMDACFRCHDHAGKRRASGKCKVCHPKNFKLVPDTHEKKGWLHGGHAEAATESLTEYGVAKAEAEELIAEGVSEEVAVPVEHCSTCHKKKYCSNCHDRLAKALEVSRK